MHRVDADEMVRRRTAEAGFKIKLGCHVFRATGITAYLEEAAGGMIAGAGDHGKRAAQRRRLDRRRGLDHGRQVGPRGAHADTL
jgi:hypothetical protein